jgi:hypothetical protein
MKRIFLINAVFLVFGIVSCTDDCTTPTPDTHISNTEWFLHYFEGSAGNDVFYAPQTFIKSGKATYPATLPHGINWFTEYVLPVPEEIDLNLDSDSLKIVANVRNVNGDGNSYEIDLGLRNDSSLYASWQKQSLYVFYCQINIGAFKVTNITEHLLDPSTFGEYALQIQNNTVSTFKNNTLLKSVSHSGNRGGRVEWINVSFRGYGEIDWVKLYNGSKLIMSEDFNTDGTTTAIWTMP